MNHGKNFEMEALKAKGAEHSLPEYLDMSAAEFLKKDLLEFRGSDLSLDASQVQRVGTLCVQILLSARKTWQSDGKKFEITQATEELFDAIRQIGLGPEDLSIAGEEI